MKKGYAGKILWVDLGKKTFTPEVIDDEIYELFLGGYGLASKIIFDRQKPGLSKLHPDNIVAVMSGLLTNGRALFNGRWMLAGKSPLTETWGDSNCGGNFAPSIKESGYDGYFIIGKSKKPVYILIDDDKLSIEDAEDLWGKRDAVETEEYLQQKHGLDFRVISIGSGGENLSLISGVVNDKGRLAGRSGFGALFGSKNLKAICVRGSNEIEVHNEDEVWKYSVKMLEELNTKLDDFGKTMKNCGTAGTLTDSAESGDSPIKNWVGVGEIDFPKQKADKINAFNVTKYEVEKYHCYGCPFGCGGICSVPGKELLKETHRPEYETLCGFGAQLLNDDLQSVFVVNEMCNRAGIDTISCATTINWAFEMFDKGKLTLEDTGHISLDWGRGESVIKVVEQLVHNKGFGAKLKDGLREAVKNLNLSEETASAMHVHGQELPMHDSRFKGDGGLGLGIGYETEPTPGRHTSTFPGIDAYLEQEQERQLNELAKKLKFQRKFKLPANETTESVGVRLKNSSCGEDIINALGLCNFGFYLGPMLPLVEWTNNTIGFDYTIDDYIKIGQRIKTVRHAFNVREKINTPKIEMPQRARGNPPLKEGPNAYSANVLQWDDAKTAYFEAMGWNPETGYPLEETLNELNLPEVRHQLYPA